jgi:NAD(P)-dependent dehydrogenase (short-subunit alcohol dehydrogenase family)
MVNRKGKTVGRNKEAGGFTRYSTEDFEFATQGILVASYRVASLSALGMAGLEPLDDGERGSIILTSSVAAQDGQVGQVGYGAAKGGVNGMVLPMARDLMDIGVRVNAIMPGIFGTPLLAKLPQQVFDNLSASVPFPKRLGKPEEFASLALELVRNSYFNGQSVRLDGAIRMAPR